MTYCGAVTRVWMTQNFIFKENFDYFLRFLKPGDKVMTRNIQGEILSVINEYNCIELCYIFLNQQK